MATDGSKQTSFDSRRQICLLGSAQDAPNLAPIQAGSKLLSNALSLFDALNGNCRVYKKVSTNGKLTLYLINRDMIIDKESVTALHAVVTVDDDELRNRKVISARFS